MAEKENQNCLNDFPSGHHGKLLELRSLVREIFFWSFHLSLETIFLGKAANYV